ncbi:beta strand repeat-containing protein [Vibrio rotiferianus]|uniref:beta strand repeat-containing protein n=1 Tax=Vibrio rotiferianus TaxID=190895 RepID=UPI00390A2DFC
MGQIDLRTLLGTTVVIGLDGNIKQLENGESPLSGELVIQELSQPNDVTIQRVGRDGTTQDITSDVQQVFEAIAQGLDPAELGEEFNPAAGEGLGSSPQVTGAIDRTGAESLAATLFETNASGFGVLSNTQILSLLELFQSFQSGELLTLPVIQDISSPTINEGENVVFDVTLDQPGSQDTELTLILNDGTAFDGQDFDSLLVEISLPDGTVVNPQLGPQGELIVTLPSGESGLQLTIPTIEDDITEGDESFTLSGTTTAQQTPVQGTATIVDNDDTPTVTDVALVGETVPEGQAAEFKVTLSNASSSDQTYAIGLFNGTAGDEDYDTNVSNIVFSDGVTYDANTGQITVPAGITMFTATVDTTQDTIDEPDETFDLQVGGVTGTATIIDDDGVPTITDVALVGETVPEGQPAEFKVTLSNASSSDQTYTIGLVNGTAGDNDYDTNVSNIVFSDGVTYDANTGQITVPAGVTMFTAIVDTTQDTIDEPDETFDLQVGGVTGTATIIDDDGVPTITDVALVGDTVPEGQAAEFKVTLSNASSSDQTYMIGLLNGTAGDDDYDTNVSNIVFSDGVTYDANTGQITVPAGVTMFTATVDTTQDTIDEPDETFDLQVGGVTGTATIIDDDGVPTITDVALVGDTVPEGQAAEFKVTLSNASSSDQTYMIGLLNGTAGDDDYDTNVSNIVFSDGVTYDANTGQITVPAGVTMFTATVDTTQDTIDEPDETFDLQVGGVTGTATIIDDDGVPTITDVALVGDTVPEGQPAEFKVTLSNASSSDQTYTIGLVNGTAGDDDYDTNVSNIVFSDGVTYDANTGQITVPAGVTMFTATVDTTQDTIDEPDETFDLQVGGVTGTATIIDDDGVPTITDVALVGETVPEGQPAEFKVTLSNASSSDQTYTIGLVNGTAGDDDYDTNVSNIVFSDGVTYDANTGQITVPAGVTMFTATVDTTQDTIDEPDETFDLQVGGVTGTATIIDDDGVPTITDVALVGETVPEGQPAEFKVTLSNASSSDQTYAIGLFNGTAGDEDYDTNLSNIVFSDGVTYDANTGQITVPAGITMFTATVDTTQDTIDELDETFDLQVGGVTGTATIIDDDGVPTITDVALVGETVPEGQPAEFKVTLSNASSSDQTYTIGLVNGTAGDNDYDTNESNIVLSDGVTYDANTGQITVPAGVTMFTATVDTTQDTIDEPDETFDLQVGGVNGTATIQDDDDVPVITNVALVGETVSEGQPAEFKVTLSNASSSDQTYTIGLVNGTAGDNDYDTNESNIVFSDGVTYDANTGQITVPAGVTMFTATVDTTQDTIDEPDETFDLQVGGVNGTATIQDDDDAPVITEVALVGETVPEGQPAEFKVTLSNASSSDQTYTIGLVNGTAGDDDYDTNVSNIVFSDGVTYDANTGQITVPAGVTMFTATVDTTQDTIDEPDETFDLQVGGVTGTATIQDDDDAPVITEVALVGETVPEGQPAEFKVMLSNASSSDQTYTIGLVNGTAGDNDYDTNVSNIVFSDGVTYDANTGQITVPAGVTIFTATVETTQDTIDEPDETFDLQVGGVTGTATIQDDDDAPVITDVALVGDTVPEGQAAEFKVTLSNASTSDQTYTIGLVNGTAGDDDYDTNVSNIVFSDGVTYDANTGQITVPAGVTMFTATVDTTQDTIDEPDETFDLQVGGVTGTATIQDDDDAPVITNVALVGETVPEGQAAEFKVTLSNASSSDQTYTIGLFNGTAGDDDYDTNVSNIVFSDGVTYDANTGQITVPAGITMFTATVDTTQDTIDEPDETFDLQVGGVTGTATIQDDDDAPVITEVALVGDTVPEGQPAEFKVTLSNASTSDQTYTIGLVNGTAGDDDYDTNLSNIVFSDGVTYDANTGQITVPAGVTMFTATVDTTQDTIDEPDETFDLQVGGVTGTATIIDDDLPNTPPTVRDFGILLDIEEGIFPVQDVDFGSVTGAGLQRVEDLEDDAVTANDGDIEIKIVELPSFGELFFVDENNQEVIIDQDFLNDSSNKLYEDTEVKYRLTEDFFDEQSFDSQDLLDEFDKDFLADSVDVNGLSFYGGTIDSNGDFVNNAQIKVDFAAQQVGLVVVSPGETGQGDEISTSEFIAIDLDDGLEAKEARLNLASLNDRFNSGAAWINVYFYMDGVLAETQVIQTDDLVFTGNQQGFATVAISSGSFDEIRLFPETDSASDKASFTLVGTQITSFNNVNDSFDYQAVDSGGLTSTDTATVDIEFSNVSVDAVEASAVQVASMQANNIVQGTDQDDTLVGTDGNDILIGGLGDDLLTGGGGNDVFKWTEMDDATDTVTDFGDGDSLDFVDLFDGVTEDDLSILLDDLSSGDYAGQVDDISVSVTESGINSTLTINKDGQQLEVNFDGASAADIANNLISNLEQLRE